MRFYKLFKTLEDRRNWLDDMKSYKDFVLCFRTTVKQLAKDTYLSDEEKAEYMYAVVYRYE